MRDPRPAVVALVPVLVLALTACAGSAGGTDRITVFAAASLGDAFAEVAGRFERAHGVEVALNLAGSQHLAAQVRDGAPADVLATADRWQMERVGDAGLLSGSPRVFARNRLVIAVAPGNPLEVRGLADLARPDLVVVLAAPDVPAGAYGRAALAAEGVEVEPDSLELSARSVLTKVALGEADAGIVYATDAASSRDVEAVDLHGPGGDVVAEYLVAGVRGAGPLADRFVDFLVSPAGRTALADHGFGPP